MFRLLPQLVQSVRFLSRNRGMAIAAVITLGLGIGAGTALFSVAHAVIFDQLPVKEPDRLVLMRFVADREISKGLTSGWNSATPDGLQTTTSLPFPTFEKLRNHSTVLDPIFAFSSTSGVNINAHGRSEITHGQLVSGNFFSGLGLKPAVGRLIGGEDDRAEAAPVVVLRHGYWLHRFGGERDVVGKTILLNRNPYTVIGVTEPGFRGTLQVGTTADFFTPLAWMETLHGLGDLTRKHDSWWLQIMGRLRPGVETEQAQAVLNPLFQRSVRQAIEERNQDKDLTQLVLPKLRLDEGGQGQSEMRERLAQPIRTTSYLVGLLLLLAGVNTAALLLSKATQRRREMAIRLSLGSSRWQLAAQLATESILLSLLAGGLGVLLAVWGKELMTGLVSSSASLTSNLEVAMNWQVLFFSLGISALAGLLFGLLPAVSASRVDPAPALKDTSASVTLSRSARFLGRGFVATQVALAVVLLVAAGLLLGTLQELLSVDPGFKAQSLIRFSLDPSSNGYEPAEAIQFYQRLAEELRAHPAVQSVSYSSQDLIGGGVLSFPFVIEGEPSGSSLFMNYAGPGFFATMGIPVLLGRDFGPQDDASHPAAIVSESLARRYFEGDSPLGKVIQADLGPQVLSFVPGRDQKFEVVGVVGNTKYAELREDFRPTVFLPALQNPVWMSRNGVFAVRIATSPSQIEPEIEGIVRHLDPDLPITEMRSYEVQIENSINQERQFARVTGFFGVVALILVAVGLYGTLSHAVACRTSEFGVRMALGADRGRIVRLVMRELGVVLTGLALGLAGAAAATRLLESLLYGLDPIDPTTFAAASAIMVAVAALAIYLPARTASRIDPLQALRSE